MPVFTDLTTIGGSMNISGNPRFYASTALSGPFGAPSYTAQMNYCITEQPDMPESCGIDHLINNVGSGINPYVFKVARLCYVDVKPGGSDGYGLNAVVGLRPGVASNVEAIAVEADLSVGNAHYGDAYGPPQQPYATTNYSAFSNTSYRASAMEMYNVTGPCNKGVVFWSGNGNVFRQSTIEDYMTADSFALVKGSYRKAPIDMSGANHTDYAVKVRNNVVAIGARNSANTGDIAIAKVNSADRVELPSATEVSTDRGLWFSNQTSAAGSQTATLTNAPVAGDPTHWLKVNINGQNLTIPAWAG
jgi:hypothetical protein